MSAVNLRLNFSSKLNSQKRRLVHEVGEENKLVHKIVGEGNAEEARLVLLTVSTQVESWVSNYSRLS